MNQDSDKPTREQATEEEATPTLTIDGADDLIKEAEAAQEAREEVDTGGEATARTTELEQQLEATKDRMLRLQADFDNFRRRAVKERHEFQQFGHENFIKDLLPTVDNLERALDHAKGNHGDDVLAGLVEGVELVLRELVTAMGKHGVTPVEAEGQPFDPSLHEAMGQTADDSVPVNTVIDVFQKGYELRNRLLRPARVIVSAKPAKVSEGEEQVESDES